VIERLYVLGAEHVLSGLQAPVMRHLGLRVFANIKVQNAETISEAAVSDAGFP